MPVSWRDVFDSKIDYLSSLSACEVASAHGYKFCAYYGNLYEALTGKLLGELREFGLDDA